MPRDEREQGKSPKPSDEQSSPAPERPVDPQELKEEGKPSQAEGEREQS